MPFYGCSALERYKVGESNTKYSVTEDGVLIYNRTTLIAYPPGKKDKEYTVPNGITSIGSQAFRTNENIEQLNLLSGVKSISGAFQQATKLTNITYYDTIENWNKISKNGFNSSSNIKTITCTDGTINL